MTFVTKLEAALAPIKRHARDRGIKPETAVAYATGDPRALQAMRRKAAAIDARIARLTAYLASEDTTKTQEK